MHTHHVFLNLGACKVIIMWNKLTVWQKPKTDFNSSKEVKINGTK